MTRNPALDGLRGVAIALVLAFHALEGTALAFDAGRIGVDLFFALSGFLITRQLEANVDRPDYWAWFWRRRSARVLPLYTVVLAVVGLLRVVELDASPAAPWWAYATFSSNVWQATHGYGTPFLMVTWSLCVEEQFYAVWSVVARFAGRHRDAGALLLGLCGAVLVVSPLLRFVLLRETGPDGAAALYLFTPTRLDSLAAGAVVALLPLREPTAGEAGAGMALLPWMAVAATNYAKDVGAFEIVDYSFIAVGCAWWVRLAAAGEAPMLTWWPLRWLGDRAFGLYLLHYPAIHLAGPWLGIPLALLLADVSWRTLERPALWRWR